MTEETMFRTPAQSEWNNALLAQQAAITSFGSGETQPQDVVDAIIKSGHKGNKLALESNSDLSATDAVLLDNAKNGDHAAIQKLIEREIDYTRRGLISGLSPEKAEEIKTELANYRKLLEQF